MKIYAVLLAGGTGVKFWPRTRERFPKQILNLLPDKTLIRGTIDRVKKIVDPENIYIVTNKTQKLLIQENIGDIPLENILTEPFGKNTAASIALANTVISSKEEDAITIILPSDHLIEDFDKFNKALQKAIKEAENSSKLISIGIKPDHVNTEYGYMQTEDPEGESCLRRVTAFAEKPNFDTAERFVKSGDFIWNSGISVWRIKSIKSEFRKYTPDMFYDMEELKKHVGKDTFEEELVSVFSRLKHVSIDVAVLELSRNLYSVLGEFDWKDVGDYNALHDILDKDAGNNYSEGDIFLEDTENSYIYAKEKFTAVVGLKDVIVVDTKDALLICDINNARKVKSVINYLRFKDDGDLL